MKNLNKIIYIFFSIIIVGLIFGMEVYFIRGMQERSAPITGNLNSQKDFVMKTDNETGENIFINYVYNYSIYLPQDWLLEKIDKLNYVVFFDQEAGEQEIDAELGQGMKIEIIVNEITEPITLDEIINQEKEDAGQYLISEKSLEVEGIAAKEIITHLLGYNIGTYFIQDNVFYAVIGYIGNYEKKDYYIELYNGIVSSLRFINNL